MNALSFHKRKLLNCILFCVIFVLGTITLLLHNMAIRDETVARIMEEKRDTLERMVLNREAAYLRFSLLSLRDYAREMGFVPIVAPRFVRRGEDKPLFAAHHQMSEPRLGRALRNRE